MLNQINTKLISRLIDNKNRWLQLYITLFPQLPLTNKSHDSYSKASIGLCYLKEKHVLIVVSFLEDSLVSRYTLYTHQEWFPHTKETHTVNVI